MKLLTGSQRRNRKRLPKEKRLNRLARLDKGRKQVSRFGRCRRWLVVLSQIWVKERCLEVRCCRVGLLLFLPLLQIGERWRSRILGRRTRMMSRVSISKMGSMCQLEVESMRLFIKFWTWARSLRFKISMRLRCRKLAYLICKMVPSCLATIQSSIREKCLSLDSPHINRLQSPMMKISVVRTSFNSILSRIHTLARIQLGTKATRPWSTPSSLQLLSKSKAVKHMRPKTILKILRSSIRCLKTMN